MTRVYLIKFRDGQTVQTIPTDLDICACIQQACIKTRQILADVVAAREVR